MSGQGSSAPQLAEVISHELRNPLASAVANLSVAGEMTDAGDPRSTFLAQALSDLDRVSALLTSYLDPGDAPRMAVGFDLVECLRKVIAGAAAQARRRGKACRFHLDLEATGESPRLVGDPILIERMIENLLENAIAVGAHTVEVRMRRDADDCLIEVVDDGPGLPAGMGEDIFAPGISGRGSSGLGLALCRQAAARHQGDIRLADTAAGACFEVRLPVSWR